MDKRQYSILSERYFECLLGDFSALLWMVGQAPLVALLMILRWHGYQPTETLYFMLALSCLWFGCINSCREISREFAIYKRERLFGLNRTAYLASKVHVLMLVGCVETGLFFFLLNHYLDLGLQSLLCFIAMLGLYFSGMCLGLFISRWSGSVAKAVISVPVVMIPQIVFSKFMLPENTLKGLALPLEKLMLVKWGFQSLLHCKSGEIAWGDYSFSLLILLLLSVVLLALTLFHLWFVDCDFEE